jgi:hypothetical protein
LDDRLKNYEMGSIITGQYKNLWKISHALMRARIAVILYEKAKPYGLYTARSNSVAIYYSNLMRGTF